MVLRKALSRKALFAAALVEAGMSAPEFAEQIGEVSLTQLHRTLKNPVNSAPLTAKIDAFILKHVGQAVRVPSPTRRPKEKQEARRPSAKAS